MLQRDDVAKLYDAYKEYVYKRHQQEWEAFYLKCMRNPMDKKSKIAEVEILKELSKDESLMLRIGKWLREVDKNEK